MLFDSTTWFLIFVLMCLVGGVIALVVLPNLGVNVKEWFEKFLKSEDDIVEDKSNYNIVPTNDADRPIVVDLDTGEETEIAGLSKENGNNVALWKQNDDGKLSLFTEIEDQDMLRPEDSLKAFRDMGGMRWIVDRNAKLARMKTEMIAIKARLAIKSAENKTMMTKTLKQEVVDLGDTMKEARKAIYGSSKNSGDRFGFGSRYGRSGLFGGGGIEGEGEEE